MATAKLTDRIQWATGYSTELVANSGFTTQLQTSVSIYDRVGINIHAVEFFINQAFLDLLVGADDAIASVLCTLQTYSHNHAATPPWQAGCLCAMIVSTGAAAVDGTNQWMPKRFQFPSPMLVHPAALYLHTRGNSLAAVTSSAVRIEFTYQTLTDKDYQDIFQSIIAQNLI